MARLVGKDADARADRYAIVAARFHAEVVDALLEGCLAGFAAGGVPRAALEIERVPGAFELPLACQELAASGRYRAVVALGCVVRGETAHFDFVAGEACRGLMEAGLRARVPVILGLLTTDTLAQARLRASPRALRGSAPEPGAAAKAAPESNKGWECAQAALEMAGLLARARAAEGA